MRTKRELICICRVFYLFHPNFRQVGESGYEILSGGKWVAEWDVLHDLVVRRHYRAEFTSEKKCEEFVQRELLCKHEKTTPVYRALKTEKCISKKYLYKPK